MTSVKSLKQIPLEPTKKKRTALGNIGTNANKDNMIENFNIKQEVTKKSRYLPAPGQIKKSESNTGSKPLLSFSKENFNSNNNKILQKSEKISVGSYLKGSRNEAKKKTETKSESIDVKLASTKISTEELPYENIDTETDEFNCPDYAESIFEYYRQRDNQFSVGDYIKDQPYINKQMRLLLVDWMVEVQQQLEFNHEILYLSVKILDLYLNHKRIEKEKLQLLGGAAMLVACKFEERMAPPLDDFIFVSDNAYDRNELVKMEIDILRTLEYDIGIPLSYTFLRRYAKCVKADMKFLTLARFILELSLQDYKFAPVKDSLKACAALYLALKMATRYESMAKNNGNMILTTDNLTDTEWNSTLVHYTGAYLSDFIEYIPLLNNLVMTASASRYKTILKKYCHPVFYEVAKIPSLQESEIKEVQTMCLTDKNISFRRKTPVNTSD